MAVIKLIGEVGHVLGITSQQVADILQAQKGSDITFDLTTIGGDFFTGIDIMNQLRDYSGKITINLAGVVASAGTIVAMGADKVIANPTSMYMIHNAQGGLFGDHKAMKKTASELERFSNIIVSEYKNRTLKGEDEIKTMMDAETWMIGKEIVENGFADEFVGVQNRDEMLVMAKAKIKLESMKKPETIREFEATLRELGFSNKQSIKIACKGFASEAGNVGIGVIVMDKEQALAFLKSENVPLAEIAKYLGKSDELKDPAQIASLEQQLAAVETERVTARLDKEFGASVSLRHYAGRILSGVKLNVIESAIDEFKNDEVAKKLAAESADVRSAENAIHEEKNQITTTGKMYYGRAVEEV